MERIQKFIAESGYCSRRKAEELIKKGKVSLNGKIVDTLGVKVNHDDIIIIDGVKLEKQDKEYYLFNKPRGVVSTTSDDKHRKTVMDYFESENRFYPVGRLDYDTTGLLIITNDGEFANMMTHPKNNIEKVYIVKVSPVIKGEQIRLLKKGIQLEDSMCIPDRVKLKKSEGNTSLLEVIIHEGKNHQVKKMFEHIGYEVLKLTRIRIGFLTLEGIASGKHRKLKPKEIQQLYGLGNKKNIV